MIFLLVLAMVGFAMRIGYIYGVEKGYNKGFNDAPEAIKLGRELLVAHVREHARLMGLKSDDDQ